MTLKPVHCAAKTNENISATVDKAVKANLLNISQHVVQQSVDVFSLISVFHLGVRVDVTVEKELEIRCFYLELRWNIQSSRLRISFRSPLYTSTRHDGDVTTRTM